MNCLNISMFLQQTEIFNSLGIHFSLVMSLNCALKLFHYDTRWNSFQMTTYKIRLFRFYSQIMIWEIKRNKQKCSFLIVCLLIVYAPWIKYKKGYKPIAIVIDVLRMVCYLRVCSSIPAGNILFMCCVDVLKCFNVLTYVLYTTIFLKNLSYAFIFVLTIASTKK